ncbi:hypothetical protein FC75_GL002154 [Lacticaseibacillus camelliae DSM 22697 = JCM 13995]|uniref:LicD/FKTN/FKRP nucleotidyltransferase domain-containing protein n=2 Tax=Lacticaseibacillus camelliae TaxID=381742 RepID=A0A0R2EZX6_9LACO|nr:hypothetical protein FC75_GL002154 [Lacticaseibacillus camelliae DSM 22697 = JCM 13995]
MTLQQIQECELNILSYIDGICRSHGLRYSIFYGSLIGLERHHGFIPWDDDIDIVLARPDYDRLIKLLAGQSDYPVLSFETRAHYRYAFAKVVDPATTMVSHQVYGAEDPLMGVFVDIFALDGAPAGRVAQYRFHDECEKLRENMMDTLPNGTYARSFSRWKAYVKRVIRYPHYRSLMAQGDDNYWRQRYVKTMTRYSFDKASECGRPEYLNEDWGVFPVAWFSSDEFEDVNFAGRTVMAIKARKEFLTLRFGDYMKMPPASARVTNHPYTFYFK